MNACRFLVTDDHELILNGICAILTNKLGVKSENIDTFISSDHALLAIKNNAYDLYILDLEFQKLSGFDLIQSIREENSEAKIIVCTMHQEIWNVNRLMEANVDGVILKNSATVYLEQAVECVVRGEKFLCPKFKEIRQKSLSYRNRLKSSFLTDREKTVLEFIVNGYSSRKIASQLEISENGVEKHRKNLFLKLDVENVTQLVRVAIYHRLIEL